MRDPKPFQHSPRKCKHGHGIGEVQNPEQPKEHVCDEKVGLGPGFRVSDLFGRS
eukprot:CAMPEP_0184558548 /NCGR_PEP_ID=MMETSP0199_2-20130426/45748_1 /TAXON_ID=1112570 /ORGANISM="Thraustochytrium sp., Strain LLF1b" /LENGTH=53 /DNA_ID=CAMNT_0026955783 /DNA_START=281 /DNA_END=442 /DNA_ORIENTATION=+